MQFRDLSYTVVLGLTFAGGGCRVDSTGLQTEMPIVVRDGAFEAVHVDGRSDGAGGAASLDGSGATDGMVASDGAAGGSGGAGGGGVDAGAGGAGGTGPGCGPGTCMNGCCAGNVCVTATTAQQCGNGGGACAPCGPCEMCANDGSCQIDPASRWQVVCASAQLNPAPPSGTTWDPRTGAIGGTAPDPFCQFEMPAGSLTNAGATDTVIDALSASWNAVVTPTPVTAAVLLSSSTSWRLWVGDDDGCNSPLTCAGQLACQIQQPMQADWLRAGGFTLQNLGDKNACLSLTVGLICQP